MLRLAVALRSKLFVFEIFYKCSLYRIIVLNYIHILERENLGKAYHE